MQNSERNMQDYFNMIENFLPEVFKTGESSPQVIVEAMQYSLMNGGKRIRPILSLAVADILLNSASSFQEIKNYASAVELIHCYSLIHDDLPAMDDDDMRRGKPSNHKVYGEGMAILAGDALLTKAFQLMYKFDNRHESISDKNILKAWANLADLASDSGMIGGQVLDIEAEGKSISLDYLERLQSLKTSCLIRSAIEGPAILLNASQETFDLLSEFALYLGRAFQIQDDILDQESTEEVLGKTIGKDEKNQKATYVTILGLAEAKKMQAKIEHACLDILKQLELLAYDISFLRNIVELLSRREN